MTPFCITLELRSPLGTPLAADTLWGHIAWGIRYRAGILALEKWLRRYDAGDPPVIFGDPLPAGQFPRPMLPQEPRPRKAPNRTEIMAFKQNARRHWISHGVWKQVSGKFSSSSLAEALRVTPPTRGDAPVHETAITHAGVNRLTGGTAQLDGGSLFETFQTFHARNAQFEVWGYSPEPLETVRQWFEWGLEGGYGRDAATGLGHLIIKDCRRQLLPSTEKPNAVMLLGPAIPRPDDPTSGFFTTTVKSGRLGGDFAIGRIPDSPDQQRQKYPVTLLQTGTVLICDTGLPHIGRVISGIHQNPDIRQYGLAPTLPLRLADEILSHPLLAVASQETSA